MAKDGKTEKATPRKRKKEREQGKVIKSKELGIFFNFLSFTLLILYFGDELVKQITTVILLSFDYIEQGMELKKYFSLMMGEAIKIFTVVALGIMITMAVNYVIQVGFLFSIKAFTPDFKRLNPANYFKNLFTRRKVIDVLRSLIIFIVLGTILYIAFKDEIAAFATAINLHWVESLTLLKDVTDGFLLKMLLALGVIAFIDYAYQRYEFNDGIKMSKNDIRDEMKDADGDPHVKARRRRAMMDILKNDIVQKTPKATVILTNPTHYSVALFYKKGEGAPRVLVKGVDNHALFIRKIANINNIPLYEDPPLAREIYSRVMANDEIPEDLYAVVIAVLQNLVKMDELKLEDIGF